MSTKIECTVSCASHVGGRDCDCGADEYNAGETDTPVTVKPAGPAGPRFTILRDPRDLSGDPAYDTAEPRDPAPERQDTLRRVMTSDSQAGAVLRRLPPAEAVTRTRQDPTPAPDRQDDSGVCDACEAMPTGADGRADFCQQHRPQAPLPNADDAASLPDDPGPWEG